jgi:hypothetical protein
MPSTFSRVMAGQNLVEPNAHFNSDDNSYSGYDEYLLGAEMAMELFFVAQGRLTESEKDEMREKASGMSTRRKAIRDGSFSTPVSSPKGKAQSESSLSNKIMKVGDGTRKERKARAQEIRRNENNEEALGLGGGTRKDRKSRAQEIRRRGMLPDGDE